MELEPVIKIPFWRRLVNRQIPLMIAINFLHNSAAYGCMIFFTEGLKAKHFSAVQYGFLFAVPYAVTAVTMVLNSWHSDKTEGTARPCRTGLYPERSQPDPERADDESFLAVVRLALPGHSRPVCRPGPLLGNSHGDPAAKGFWPGHRPGECIGQHRRFCRSIYCGLVEDRISECCDSLHRTSASACWLPPGWPFYCPKLRGQLKPDWSEPQ